MKRIIYTLASVMLSVGAWAQTSLQEQINNAEAGTTVTLTENVNVSQTILINKNITINGDGHTITSSVTNNLGTFYVNVPASNFNITNATIDGNNTASMAVCAYRGEAKDDLSGTVSVVNNNTDNIITLTDCTVKNFTGYPGSYVGAVYAFSTSTFNLNNCNFTGNSTTLKTDGASGADVWAGAAAKVYISGGSYQEVFVNSNAGDHASISISGGATVAKLAVCVTEKGEGVTNQPAITVDGATVTNITTETGNFLPSNAVTITNAGTVQNIRVAVAQIGDVKYQSLAEAIAAANAGETISLLENITTSTVNEFTITKTLTLDLAGHTITSSVEQPIWIKDSGNLTITGNGTIAGPTGTAGKALDGKAMIVVEGTNAKLTYLNGTLTCGGEGSDGMYGVYILNGGTAVFGQESDHTGPLITSWFAAIGENNTTAPAYITVYGGAYRAQATPSESDWWHYFCAPLYAAGSGAINITGGEFIGYYAVSSRYGNVAQNLNIKGGTFTGTKQALFIDNQSGVESSASRDVAVSGGTFSSAVPEEYCAPGFIPQDDGNGHYGVKEGSFVAQIDDNKYETLSAAIAAATEGQTVKLIVDITEAVVNENTNNFTIDLNGKTWTSSGYALTNNGGTITLQGDGTVKSTAANGIAVWARTGSIIIEGGNYENCSNEEATVYVGTKNEYLGGKQPTITIKGGTFKNTATGKYKWNETLLPLTLNIHNDIANADAYQAIVINGGIFHGDDPSYGDDSQLNKVTKNSNFVNPDKHAELNAQGVFEIKEGGYVAQLGYHKYTTISDCITQSTATNTIILLNNVEIENINKWKEGVLIDKNNHELTVTNYELFDGSTFSIPFDFKAAKATYTRGVESANNYGTICVPFTLKSCDAYKLYTVVNIADDKLNITETTSDVAPGTSVIFCKQTADATSVTFTTTDAAVVKGIPSQSSDLKGTYVKSILTDNLSDIYYINDDHFHQAKARLTVPAYRAYIKNSGSASKSSTLSLVVTGEQATAISAPLFDGINTVEALYDINGRKLAAPQKGMNIMKLANGKTIKLIIK